MWLSWKRIHLQCRRHGSWEDPLEKGKATHSSILSWRIPWTVQYSPWGRKESDTTEQLSLSLFRDSVIKSPVPTLNELIANNRQGMCVNVLITVLNITYQMNECMLK